MKYDKLRIYLNSVGSFRVTPEENGDPVDPLVDEIYVDEIELPKPMEVPEICYWFVHEWDPDPIPEHLIVEDIEEMRGEVRQDYRYKEYKQQHHQQCP